MELGPKPRLWDLPAAGAEPTHFLLYLVPFKLRGPTSRVSVAGSTLPTVVLTLWFSMGVVRGLDSQGTFGKVYRHF